MDMPQQIDVTQLTFSEPARDACSAQEEILESEFRSSKDGKGEIPGTEIKTWLNDNGTLTVSVRLPGVRTIGVILERGDWEYKH